jgi:hypothetical protein
LGINDLLAQDFTSYLLIMQLSTSTSAQCEGLSIIYELDHEARVIRLFAVGYRREVFEELADRLRQAAR